MLTAIVISKHVSCPNIVPNIVYPYEYSRNLRRIRYYCYYLNFTI